MNTGKFEFLILKPKLSFLKGNNEIYYEAKFQDFLYDSYSSIYPKIHPKYDFRDFNQNHIQGEFRFLMIQIQLKKIKRNIKK